MRVSGAVSGEEGDSTNPANPAPAERHRLRQRLPRKAWVGLTIIGLYAAVALLAPLLAPYDPLDIDPINRLAAPSAQHWLGTDEIGRDVLSRLLYAARTDLPIGFLGAFLPAMVGITLGLIAGFSGGLVDNIIMRAADVVQAFPSYILVLVLVFALGPGATSILVAFTVLAWVIYARLIRTEVLRVRELEYIQAARLAGIPRVRIIATHVFPNVIGQVLVYFPSDILYATLALASFSFLGLGIPAPTPEWGAMIASGHSFLRDQWWLATVPGLLIVGWGLGLSLLAEGTEESRRS